MFVVPDNDRAGIDGARRNAQTLTDVGATARILKPLGGEPDSGSDFTDWAEEIRRQHPEQWKERRRRELWQRAERALGVSTHEGSHEPRSVEIRDSG